MKLGTNITIHNYIDGALSRKEQESQNMSSFSFPTTIGANTTEKVTIEFNADPFASPIQTGQVVYRVTESKEYLALEASSDEDGNLHLEVSGTNIVAAPDGVVEMLEDGNTHVYLGSE